jgi:hypothetical protein
MKKAISETVLLTKANLSDLVLVVLARFSLHRFSAELAKVEAV